MSGMDDLFGHVPQAVDHRCLGCGQEHAGARQVALVDGTLVSSYSEAWRVECEARSLMGRRSLAKRQEALANIERRRGRDTAEQLRDIMLAIWGKSKGVPPEKKAA